MDFRRVSIMLTFVRTRNLGISAGPRHCRQVLVDVGFQEVGSAYRNSALSSTAGADGRNRHSLSCLRRFSKSRWPYGESRPRSRPGATRQARPQQPAHLVHQLCAMLKLTGDTICQSCASRQFSRSWARATSACSRRFKGCSAHWTCCNYMDLMT
jgi:hypothetical protein